MSHRFLCRHPLRVLRSGGYGTRCHRRHAAPVGTVFAGAFASGGALISATSYDDVNYAEKEKKVLEGYEDRSSLSSSDRLKLMFRRDVNNQLSPELNFVYSATFVSATIGLLMGAYKSGNDHYVQYIKENKHAMFENPFQAQKDLQKSLGYYMFKGGFRLGGRLLLVTGVFSLVSTTITVYRNKASPLDHAAAGVVLGGCYRFMAGPRPAAAAAAIGGGLGLMGGIAATAVQFASGETVEERWRREYKRQKLADDLADRNKPQDEISSKRVVTDTLKPSDSWKQLSHSSSRDGEKEEEVQEKIEDRNMIATAIMWIREVAGLNEEDQRDKMMANPYGRTT